jgi:hypothetical protein
MDDFNRKMQEARRNAAKDHTQRMDRDAELRAQTVEPPRPSPPEGSGRLKLARTQGEWRYSLAEERVRSGDTIEFYVGPDAGWLRGVFEWGRRNTSAPVLRVRIVHPEDAHAFLGDAAITLPEEAVCRWPTG